MEFKDYVKQAVEEQIQQIVAGDNEVIKLLQKDVEEQAKVKLFTKLLKRNGKLTDKQSRYMLKDLLTSEEFVHYFPKVITELAGEVYENTLVVTNLLEKVYVDAAGSITIQTPNFTGALGQDLDIPEGGEYPELVLKVGTGAFQTVVIGKSGLVVNITEEAINYSRYDIVNNQINEGLKALARWKERKAIKMFIESAQVVKNSGSGVDVSGTANSGLTIEDIIDVAVQMMDKGFTPDTIIMHPLAYPIFAFNGTLRQFFYASTGDKGSLVQWPKIEGGQPKAYEFLGKTADLNGKHITSIELPTGIIGKPLRVILSRFVPFNKTTKETDLYIVDSENVGYLYVVEEPTTTDFDDPLRDIRKLKIYERYGMAPKFGGAAIGKIAGVKAVKTFDPVPFYALSPGNP